MIQNNKTTPLKIYTFKDISEFVFTLAKSKFNLDVDIYYVNNANESHVALKNNEAEIVLMSYDDTLSVMFEDKYDDIVAVMPVHKGILDLCGRIDLLKNTVKIGIDTASGYARVLRYYLKNTYSATEYAKLNFALAGATNIRYDKLIDGELDATLLNAPFSYKQNVARLTSMYSAVGDYQGTVVNVSKSWLLDQKNQERLKGFIGIYQDTLQYMQANSEEIIKQLASFYNLSMDAAKAVYKRLWGVDGLNAGYNIFNQHALKCVEMLFTVDTNIEIPNVRSWVLNDYIEKK